MLLFLKLTLVCLCLSYSDVFFHSINCKILCLRISSIFFLSCKFLFCKWSRLFVLFILLLDLLSLNVTVYLVCTFYQRKFFFSLLLPFLYYYIAIIMMNIFTKLCGLFNFVHQLWNLLKVLVVLELFWAAGPLRRKLTDSFLIQTIRYVYF